MASVVTFHEIDLGEYFTYDGKLYRKLNDSAVFANAFLVELEINVYVGSNSIVTKLSEADCQVLTKEKPRMKKYVIEIEEVYEPLTKSKNGPDKLYRAKGFNSLVFDENGLRKLVPIRDEPIKTSSAKLAVERYRNALKTLIKIGSSIKCREMFPGEPIYKVADLIYVEPDKIVRAAESYAERSKSSDQVTEEKTLVIHPNMGVGIVLEKNAISHETTILYQNGVVRKYDSLKDFKITNNIISDIGAFLSGTIKVEK